MRILLTGKDGQVGRALQRGLAGHEVLPFGRSDLDLSDSARIRSVVREVQPEVIINAAANTAVDRAEEEPELAHAVNAIAPGILAEEARALGVLLVHYSTDYVFDGTASTPYKEEEAPNPVSVYGRTKLEGEEAVRRAKPDHLILRTAWVFGAEGHNFLRTMLRLFSEREEVGVVNDQSGSPTWAGHIAATTAELLARRDRGGAVPAGTYHLTAAGETTWHGFAGAILHHARAHPEHFSVVTERLNPIPTSAYPTPAKRPAYSVLDTSKLEGALGQPMQHWEMGLANAIADLKKG